MHAPVLCTKISMRPDDMMHWYVTWETRPHKSTRDAYVIIVMMAMLTVAASCGKLQLLCNTQRNTCICSSTVHSKLMPALDQLCTCISCHNAGDLYCRLATLQLQTDVTKVLQHAFALKGKLCHVHYERRVLTPRARCTESDIELQRRSVVSRPLC